MVRGRKRHAPRRRAFQARLVRSLLGLGGRGLARQHPRTGVHRHLAIRQPHTSPAFPQCTHEGRGAYLTSVRRRWRLLASTAGLESDGAAHALSTAVRRTACMTKGQGGRRGRWEGGQGRGGGKGGGRRRERGLALVSHLPQSLAPRSPLCGAHRSQNGPGLPRANCPGRLAHHGISLAPQTDGPLTGLSRVPPHARAIRVLVVYPAPCSTSELLFRPRASGWPFTKCSVSTHAVFTICWNRPSATRTPLHVPDLSDTSKLNRLVLLQNNARPPRAR